MNKKGGFELPGQMVLWIAKTLLFIFAIFIILAPINCYINRSVEDGKAESYIVIKKVISCLEREGFNEIGLKNCMESEKYGIKISLGDEEIIFNKEKYLERAYCDTGANYLCKNQTERIYDKEFLIELVMKIE